MSKVITSPVKRWPGTVTLSDPPTLWQVAEYHSAMLKAQKYTADEGTAAMYFSAMMPGIYACVERWELKNFPGVSPQTFPGKPYKDSAQLAAWLIDELTKLMTEADEEVPKESTPSPTPTASEQEEARN